jgi:hypothetical protein
MLALRAGDSARCSGGVTSILMLLLCTSSSPSVSYSELEECNEMPRKIKGSFLKNVVIHKRNNTIFQDGGCTRVLRTISKLI